MMKFFRLFGVFCCIVETASLVNVEEYGTDSLATTNGDKITDKRLRQRRLHNSTENDEDGGKDDRATDDVNRWMLFEWYPCVPINELLERQEKLISEGRFTYINDQGNHSGFHTGGLLTFDENDPCSDGVEACIDGCCRILHDMAFCGEFDDDKPGILGSAFLECVCSNNTRARETFNLNDNTEGETIDGLPPPPDTALFSPPPSPLSTESEVCKDGKEPYHSLDLGGGYTKCFGPGECEALTMGQECCLKEFCLCGEPIERIDECVLGQGNS